MSRTVFLTGVPRSGTTLVCMLLNQLSNTVALDEAIPDSVFGDLVSSRRRDELERFIAEQRSYLAESGCAVTKVVVDGTLGNHYGPRGRGLLRRSQTRRVLRFFGRHKADECDLVLKEPCGFTALLPELVASYECVAIVRNPAAVLASWRSVDLRLREGRAPRMERLRPDLTRELSKRQSTSEKICRLLGWWFDQYRRHMSRGRVLRYEDVIASGGKELARIVPGASMLDEPLESGNRPYPGSAVFLEECRQQMARPDAPWYEYYTPNEVMNALAECASP